MGPISTGLGDIFMWTVELRELDQVQHRDGEPGLQRDGSYITPDGAHLTTEADKATYLRTVQDWIVGPQRSEEHTSELQSLMRISYAVFCLQQKKEKEHTRTPVTNHHHKCHTKM